MVALRRTRIEWRRRGFDQLRNHPAVKAYLRREAERVRDAAGDGFELDDHSSPARARFTVYASTHQARRRNATENTLLRVIGGGGS